MTPMLNTHAATRHLHAAGLMSWPDAVELTPVIKAMLKAKPHTTKDQLVERLARLGMIPSLYV